MPWTAWWTPHVLLPRSGMRMLGPQGRSEWLEPKPHHRKKPASIMQRVTLYGISWQAYIRILAELGDQRAARLAYAHRVLEITMPSDRHETYKKLLERLTTRLPAFALPGLRVDAVQNCPVSMGKVTVV